MVDRLLFLILEQLIVVDIIQQIYLDQCIIHLQLWNLMFDSIQLRMFINELLNSDRLNRKSRFSFSLVLMHIAKMNLVSRKKETRRRLSSGRCQSDSDSSGKS